MDGGYRRPYDASEIIRSLQVSVQPKQDFWDEVWNNLYHQHDVGVASYAVMPWLLKIYKEKNWVDYQLPNYAFAVEQARLMGHNPTLPNLWAKEYQESIEGINDYCLRKRLECNDANFKKAVVLLTATLVGATGIAELVDFVSIGDEQRALELYAA